MLEGHPEEYDLDRDWDNGNGGKKLAINGSIKSMRKALKDGMEPLPEAVSFAD